MTTTFDICELIKQIIIENKYSYRRTFVSGVGYFWISIIKMSDNEDEVIDIIPYDWELVISISKILNNEMIYFKLNSQLFKYK